MRLEYCRARRDASRPCVSLEMTVSRPWELRCDASAGCCGDANLNRSRLYTLFACMCDVCHIQYRTSNNRLLEQERRRIIVCCLHRSARWHVAVFHFPGDNRLARLFYVTNPRFAVVSMQNWIFTAGSKPVRNILWNTPPAIAPFSYISYTHHTVSRRTSP